MALDPSVEAPASSRRDAAQAHGPIAGTDLRRCAAGDGDKDALVAVERIIVAVINAHRVAARQRHVRREADIHETGGIASRVDHLDTECVPAAIPEVERVRREVAIRLGEANVHHLAVRHRAAGMVAGIAHVAGRFHEGSPLRPEQVVKTPFQQACPVMGPEVVA